MQIRTRAVAATASKNLAAQERANLTHAVEVTTGAPICGKVKPASILDDKYATAENAVPSCPVCAKRDPRFNNEGTRRLETQLRF